MIFEVGYKDAGIFSVNMICAETGNCEREAVTDTAERHAKRYGYKVAYVKALNDSEVKERMRKGMPLYSIDDEAKQKYDPSIVERM